jgi:hypothetical protein
MHPALRDAIITHRKTLQPGAKKASYNYRFNWRYPHKIEKQVESFVAGIFKSMSGPMMLQLKQSIPDYDRNRGVVRIDESDYVIAGIVDTYIENQAVQQEEVKDSDIEKYIVLLLLFLGSEWDRFVEKYAGTTVAVPIDMELYKQGFIKQLRNSIQEDLLSFFQSTKTILHNDLSKRESYQKTYTMIFNRFKSLVLNRSKLIARNFVSNTYSDLSKIIFTIMGLPEYIWQTMSDEKVRGSPGKYAKKIPSHFVMEGIICKWANDNTYSIDGTAWQPRTDLMEKKAPGKATNCRCTGRPYIVNDLKAIDNVK